MVYSRASDLKVERLAAYEMRASISDGTAKRDVAAQMLGEVAGPGKRVTLGADKAYDIKGFVKACRDLKVTPHVAQDTKRNGGSAIDARTTRHPGYEVSQRKRKHIGECFGWGEVIGPMRQVMVKGLAKVDQLVTLTMAAYTLTRLRTLAQLRAVRPVSGKSVEMAPFTPRMAAQRPHQQRKGASR